MGKTNAVTVTVNIISSEHLSVRTLPREPANGVQVVLQLLQTTFAVASQQCLIVDVSIMALYLLSMKAAQCSVGADV